MRHPGSARLPCPQLQEPLLLHTLATSQSSFLSFRALLPVQATCARSNQHHSSSTALNWRLPPAAKVAHPAERRDLPAARWLLSPRWGHQPGSALLLLSGTRTRSVHHSGATPEHVNNTKWVCFGKKRQFWLGRRGQPSRMPGVSSVTVSGLQPPGGKQSKSDAAEKRRKRKKKKKEASSTPVTPVATHPPMPALRAGSSAARSTPPGFGASPQKKKK